MPTKLLGGYQIFIAVIISMLWLGRILPSIFKDTVPIGLEHYTTLVIQGMDLGIVVPAAFISGILLVKHNPYGYLLSSVIIMKSVTMLTSITAMIINQAFNHVKMSIVEIIAFSGFNVLAILCLILLLRNTKNENESYAMKA